MKNTVCFKKLLVVPLNFHVTGRRKIHSITLCPVLIGSCPGRPSRLAADYSAGGRSRGHLTAEGHEAGVVLAAHVDGQRVLRVEGELAELAAVATGEVDVLDVCHERVLQSGGRTRIFQVFSDIIC